VDRLPSAESARSAVEEGTVETAIIVPEGFTAATMAGTGSEIELIVDPDAVVSGQVARSVLDGFAHEVEAVQLAVTTALGVASGVPDAAAAAALAEQARQMAAPIALVEAATDDRQASNSTYYAAAMAILFVFLSAQFGLVSIHAEKRGRTLARMLASPLRWWSILAGKVIVSLVLALVSMSVIVVGTSLLLGAGWGDPIAVAALILSAAVAASGIALLAVAFTRTEEQSAAAVAIVAMVLAVLGGSFVRANQGPEVMSQLSLLTPHAWFLRGVNDAATGGDVLSVAGPAGILLAIGLGAGAMGLLRSRRLMVS
jgi:ABC-2 type transport system permease protein